MNGFIKRLLPHLVWVSGIGVMVLSVVSFGHHGVPYQDATPEQAAIQKAGIEALNRWCLFGSFLFLVGVIWGTTQSLKNRIAAEA